MKPAGKPIKYKRDVGAQGVLPQDFGKQQAFDMPLAPVIGNRWSADAQQHSANANDLRSAEITQRAAKVVRLVTKLA